MTSSLMALAIIFCSLWAINWVFIATHDVDIAPTEGYLKMGWFAFEFTVVSITRPTLQWEILKTTLACG